MNKIQKLSKELRKEKHKPFSYTAGKLEGLDFAALLAKEYEQKRILKIINRERWCRSPYLLNCSCEICKLLEELKKQIKGELDGTRKRT